MLEDGWQNAAQGNDPFAVARLGELWHPLPIIRQKVMQSDERHFLGRSFAANELQLLSLAASASSVEAGRVWYRLARDQAQAGFPRAAIRLLALAREVDPQAAFFLAPVALGYGGYLQNTKRRSIHYALKYVMDQPEAVCLKAVESNGYALRYVRDQTEAVCLKAVERYGDALQYVMDQTEAVCLKAVERDGYALKYVSDQTEAVCLKAVESNGDALKYVLDRKLFTAIAAKFGIEIEK